MTGVLSAPALFGIGLFLLVWLALALGALLRGIAMQRRAAVASAQTARLASLVEASPQIPVILRGDWRLEAGGRLGIWLGLPQSPASFDELKGVDEGLDSRTHDALRQAVIGAQRGGKSFSLVLRPIGGERELLVQGIPAPATVGGPGSVLLWVSDTTETQEVLSRMRRERDDALAAFAALSGLIEAAPFPMWFRDNDARLALVNDAYVRAIEADSAAAVIDGGMELVESVAGISAIEAAHRAASVGSSLQRLVPVTVAGERRMMRVVDVPLADSDGKAIGVAGYAVDVQELDRERAAHRRFVETQRDLLDRLSAAVAQYDADRALIFANQPFRRLFGLDARSVAESPDFSRLLDSWREAGKTPEVRDYPEWRQAHVDWFARAEAAEEDWLLRDGTHLRLVAQPTPDGGLLLIVEDRTEQIQLASTRDTLLRVRTATFDNLFEAIAVFAPDGRLHLWNQRFRKLWAVEENVLAAHPRVDALMAGLADRLAKPAQVTIVQEIIRAATLERSQRSGQIRFADGRHFDFAAIPLPDGNALLIMLDVTDSRRMEGALRERNEALEAADQVKTAFLSRMSYELRTPLTSIGGFAEMLGGGYAGELAPAAKSYVIAILESVAVLGRHIDNVLDLAQAEAGTLAIERAPVDMAGLLNEVLAATAPLAVSERVEIAREFVGEIGSIDGDAARLKRLFAQLLDNAVRFTAPARRTGARVLLHAEGHADAVEIIVSDNGPGVPDGVARALRAKATGTTSGGIGLALSRQLVEAHCGTMDVMTEKGQGTLVRVRLPRTAAKPA
ncbi:MAG: PAS-domain containing protein [Sphingopyxis sp.]|nr:PAS-domain containing protein [Sphingopyxis sp.]